MEASATTEEPQRTHDPWSAYFALHMIPTGRTMPPGCITLAAYRKDLGTFVTICYANPQDMTEAEMISQANCAGNELEFQLQELRGQGEPIKELSISHADINLTRICLQGIIAASPVGIIGIALTLMGQPPMLALFSALVAGIAWASIKTIQWRQRIDRTHHDLLARCRSFPPTTPGPMEPNTQIINREGEPTIVTTVVPMWYPCETAEETE